ncbi:MAG: hypothetical protein JOZ98_09875 [Solirubrobacterales bacterium]|nr:hypothetical protein [Solirubrobacterales bacterium]
MRHPSAPPAPAGANPLASSPNTARVTAQISRPERFTTVMIAAARVPDNGGIPIQIPVFSELLETGELAVVRIIGSAGQQRLEPAEQPQAS